MKANALLKYLGLSLHLCLFTNITTQAQELKEPTGSLKINLNPSGSKYMQLGVWNQTWLRVIENNPGTLVNNAPEATTMDAGFRRMRISSTMQLSPRYLMFFQIGINNQSFISGGGTGTGANGQGKKAPLFFHDAYNEFSIIADSKDFQKPSLYVGAGLHAWNGVSRLTNASSNKMLTADLPVYNFSNIEVSDQMSRQFGVFAHGNYKKLAYRMSVNKPFATSNKPTVINKAVENNSGGGLSVSGYYYLQLLDKENQKTSFLNGSYLGEKKIFNVGIGFQHAKNGTQSLNTQNEIVKHNNTTLGADIFTEFPIQLGVRPSYVSIYSVYYNYNFGKNYLRTTGIMNPGTANPEFTGMTALEGSGNARYLLGTGNIWHTTAGVLLPEFKKSAIKLQPYVTYARKDFEALNQVGNYFDFGTNILIDNHNAKVSLQYATRPLYSKNGENQSTVFTHRGEWLACVQIYL